MDLFMHVRFVLGLTYEGRESSPPSHGCVLPQVLQSCDSILTLSLTLRNSVFSETQLPFFRPFHEEAHGVRRQRVCAVQSVGCPYEEVIVEGFTRPCHDNLPGEVSEKS